MKAKKPSKERKSPWNLSVITSLFADPDYPASVHNAMLYGDKVTWVSLSSPPPPPNLFAKVLKEWQKSDFLDGLPKKMSLEARHYFDHHLKCAVRYYTLLDELQVAGAMSGESLVTHIDHWQLALPNALPKWLREIGSLEDILNDNRFNYLIHLPAARQEEVLKRVPTASLS